MDMKTVTCKHFCNSQGKVLGMKTFIVTNHDPLSRFSYLLHVGGKALCASADIIKGVIFCNDTAPAICTKVNRGHDPSLKNPENNTNGNYIRIVIARSAIM